MKKILLSLLLFVTASQLFAVDYDFKDENFCYKKLSSNTVSVAYSDATTYPSTISIPSTITYNSEAYTVTSIGNRAFNNSGFITVKLPNTIKSIESDGFLNCSSMTSISLPEGLTYIGSTAFGNCSALTSLTLPSTLTYIGIGAFYRCTSLSTVNIPDALSYVGFGAFDKTLWTPSSAEGVVYLGKVAYKFNGTISANTTINIKDGTTCITGEIFKNCSGLQSVNIPSSVQYIGGDAFIGTPFYNNQADGLVYLGNVLYKYKGTMPSNTDIQVKDGTLSVSDGAFNGITALKSIKMPEGVTFIGENAFLQCTGLESIDIPSTVTFINNAAFYNCTSLLKINSTIVNPASCHLGEDIFGDITKTTGTLNVPKNSKFIYQLAPQWCDFTTIVEVEGSGIDQTSSNSKVKASVNGSVITLSGVTDGTSVTFYTLSGSSLGLATAIGDTVTFDTGLIHQVIFAKIDHETIKIVI